MIAPVRACFVFVPAGEDGVIGGRIQRGRGRALCLCALMVIVALLRGAGPRSRRRLRTALLVVVGLAVTTYMLAATGGLDHAVVRYPGGGVRPL